MYAIVVFVIAMMLQLKMESIASDARDLAQMYQSRWKQMQVVQLAENLERYYVESGAFPASLDALAATPGFEQTKGLRDNWQGYGVSPVLNDGMWQFRRMVLASNNPTGGVSPTAFLAANSCGTGGYDTAQSWCGNKTGQWFRRETREGYNSDIQTQRVRLNRVLQKFADYYSQNGYFPKVDQSNNPLANNAMTPLMTLAGYAGTATSCKGVYAYQGVPIDCGDMFDKWGGAVGYQFVSKKHIVLTSESPIYANSGTRLVIASDLEQK